MHRTTYPEQSRWTNNASWLFRKQSPSLADQLNAKAKLSLGSVHKRSALVLTHGRETHHVKRNAEKWLIRKTSVPTYFWMEKVVISGSFLGPVVNINHCLGLILRCSVTEKRVDCIPQFARLFRKWILIQRWTEHLSILFSVHLRKHIITTAQKHRLFGSPLPFWQTFKWTPWPVLSIAHQDNNEPREVNPSHQRRIPCSAWYEKTASSCRSWCHEYLLQCLQL